MYTHMYTFSKVVHRQLPPASWRMLDSSKAFEHARGAHWVRSRVPAPELAATRSLHYVKNV